MAKQATAGQMNTRITVKALTAGVDADGYATETWTNIIAAGAMLRCSWVFDYGREVTENNRLGLGQTATITLRYTSLVTPRCRVWYENDAQTDLNAWEVVSVNDPEARHAFLEVTLRKLVAA